MMEEIIRPKEHEEEEKEIIEFPNLKDMGLVGLPMLKSFYCKNINMLSATPDQNTSTFPVHSLFTSMVSFPVLNKLTMSYIENVTEIWEPQRHTENSFSQLKILYVYMFNKLENVIPFAMLPRLQNIETLQVESCLKMEEIVSDENEGNKKMVATGTNAQTDEILIVFSRLKRIDLVKLPVLKSFCDSARYTFNMPSLERVVLQNCPLMINFTRRQLATPKFQILYHTDWLAEKCTDLHRYLQFDWPTEECTDLNKYLQTKFELNKFMQTLLERKGGA